MSSQQKDKRKVIKEILSLDIPQSEKNKRIFQVMNPTNLLDNLKTKEDEIFCTHYNRHNYPIFKCCKKIYPCRLCHDEKEEHKCNRFEVDYMKCNYCKTYQKSSSSCNNPECYKFNKPHKYFCKICNLWSNDKDKKLVILDSYLITNINTNSELYHCKDCGICRMGLQKDITHCHKCNQCIFTRIFDNHQCITDMKDEKCPICFKELWGCFRDTCYHLKCGHKVHTSCFKKSLQSYNYNCPLCKKSTVDLTNEWRRLDLFLSLQTMPEEYKNDKSEIFCNDCELTSTVNFHFLYHKCLSCNGYNTVVNKVIKYKPDENQNDNEEEV